MTAGAASFRWMVTLLELLFERYDRESCAALLVNESARNQAFADLAPELLPAGMGRDVPDCAQGRNLFVAVLTLRLRFPFEEARERVELNIAMREGRR